MSQSDPAQARRELLARAWDDAARGYERYFVPRFAPWTDEALHALMRRARDLPHGPVLVPCCGPGQELLPLALAFDDREVVGIDLSPGMVELARKRVGGATGIWVEEGDATTLEERFGGKSSGLLSCFGLQQLPEPDSVLASWGRCLLPGGVLSVMLWPSESRDADAFDRLRRLRQERTPAPVPTWDGRLVPALESAGLVVLEDRLVAHEMAHESPEAFFDALAQSGPMRSLARASEESFMAELRAAFIRETPRGPIVHQPKARFLLATRLRGRA